VFLPGRYALLRAGFLLNCADFLQVAVDWMLQTGAGARLIGPYIAALFIENNAHEGNMIYYRAAFING